MPRNNHTQYNIMLCTRMTYNGGESSLSFLYISKFNMLPENTIICDNIVSYFYDVENMYIFVSNESNFIFFITFSWFFIRSSPTYDLYKYICINIITLDNTAMDVINIVADQTRFFIPQPRCFNWYLTVTNDVVENT